MRILLIRHAEPDYTHDSLTPKGHREARLLADRLKNMNISAFYQSPLGRAQATASYTLKEYGASAQTMPWLAEFRGRCPDPVTGKMRIPWDYRVQYWTGNDRLLSADHWSEDPMFDVGTVRSIWKETCDGIDDLLAARGVVRDGYTYRCENNGTETIALFCHYGISAAVIGHLCNLSPLGLWQGLCMLPSSVTSVVSEERDKGILTFRCEYFGDLSHLYVAGEKPSSAALYCECYDGRDSTDPIEWERDPLNGGRPPM